MLLARVIPGWKDAAPEFRAPVTPRVDWRLIGVGQSRQTRQITVDCPFDSSVAHLLEVDVDCPPGVPLALFHTQDGALQFIPLADIMVLHNSRVRIQPGGAGPVRLETTEALAATRSFYVYDMSGKRRVVSAVDFVLLQAYIFEHVRDKHRYVGHLGDGQARFRKEPIKDLEHLHEVAQILKTQPIDVKLTWVGAICLMHSTNQNLVCSTNGVCIATMFQLLRQKLVPASLVLAMQGLHGAALVLVAMLFSMAQRRLHSCDIFVHENMRVWIPEELRSRRDPTGDILMFWGTRRA